MGRALNFLVVEDEVILAMDMEGMIADAGHRVVAEAASMPAVEDVDADIRPDIALVDVQLADGSSGVDVSGLIQKRWPDAVIVFVTANPSKVPGDYAGAHGIVAKPFSRSSFMSVIEYVAEGIVDPPPSKMLPKGFDASPKAKSAWHI